MSSSTQRKPNILVTGTPGTGKSSTSERISEVCGLTHVNVGKLIADKKLYTEWNEDFHCSEFDEDKVREGELVYKHLISCSMEKEREKERKMKQNRKNE